MAKTVTNISKLLTKNFVSNSRYQHRCSPITCNITPWLWWFHWFGNISYLLWTRLHIKIIRSRISWNILIHSNRILYPSSWEFIKNWGFDEYTLILWDWSTVTSLFRVIEIRIMWSTVMYIIIAQKIQSSEQITYQKHQETEKYNFEIKKGILKSIFKLMLVTDWLTPSSWFA